MKVRTSVTVSEKTIRAIDNAVGRGTNRSRFIEQAVRDALDQRGRTGRDARDLETINRVADELNREAQDVLSFQVET